MTKLIPILSGRCLVVELPDGSEFPRIGNGVLKAERTHNDYSVSLVRLPLPPGNWRIIGMLGEVREEQLDGSVESDTFMGGGVTIHKNYNQGGWLPARVMSLESAILAEGFTFQNNLRNPDDVCYFSRDRMIADVREYHEVQSRVLCRERCLLLGREI